MKRFNFGLEKILLLKSAMEHDQLFTVERLEQEVRRSMNEKGLMEKSLKEAQSQTESQQKGEMDLMKVGSLLSYLDLLEHQISSKRREVQEMELKLGDARRKLLDRMKERKTLEHLKDRMFFVYKKQISKQLQRWLDDYPKQRLGGDVEGEMPHG